MSLPDYYTLLQIPATATAAEIKAAYRRLAKLYHPDKNSGSAAYEEKFKQIKDAYENLINPLKRRRYDERRNRFVTPRANPRQSEKTTSKKNYSFSEEEAKRRRYYQENYKTTSYKTTKTATKKQGVSTELKYILISVPLAVALLLLIIRLYEKPSHSNHGSNTVAISNMSKEIHTPESPYQSVLGKNLFDTASHSVIKLINKSGNDALVFLQNDSQKIIRHHFIENNYELYMEKIPSAGYKVYYWTGKGFSNKNYLFSDIIGNFSSSTRVDSVKESIAIQKELNDTFYVSLPKNGSTILDSSLLKRIFKRK